ncbi:MAG: TolC family protein [Aquincola sp.]|nr:TolC family protein [Aquincola sp.]
MCPVDRSVVRVLLCAAAACLPLAAHSAGLGYAEAQELARQSAPNLRAQQATLAGSRVAVTSAGTLPDPKLTLGLEGVPVQGPDRWSLTRDTGTEQRVALMQEVPNRAKRDARVAAGQARIERDRAMLVATSAMVRRDAALAWLGVYYAERREKLIAEFLRENQLLQDTLGARIAAMRAMPADLTMARQDALMIADRGDELARDIAKARAELRRWIGERASEPLAGEPVLPDVSAEQLRARLPQSPELRPYGPMREMAAAEMAEMSAERRGDWSWQVGYARRPRYDDMVSFMLSFDLPWQRERRQQPLVDAKRREIERIEGERDDLARRIAAEAESMSADLRAMDAMHARLSTTGLALAAERVALLMASYEAGRSDLGPVLAARTQVLETRMRLIELETQRAAMRVRLATLISEE